MVEPTQHCDVCGRKGPFSPYSSGIAPVTYGLCEECRKRGAENIGVLSLWLASYGGPSTAPDFRHKLVSCIDGEYQEWQQIHEYYRANEEEILASFREEFELADDN